MPDPDTTTLKPWKYVLPAIAALLCILGMLACGCVQPAPGPVTPTPEIPNPAAMACLDDEHQYEIRKNPEGSEYGVCILADGTVCDERKYLRGECPAPATTIDPELANPAAVYCRQQNLTHQFRKKPDGSEYGVCILPKGTECIDWEYYRGECP